MDDITLAEYVNASGRSLYLNFSPASAAADWGPKHDPLHIVIPITLLYSVIFIVGVLGNVSTCIVIARNKAMHTATNYYLFSLAISDLLLLVSGLPPEMYSIWVKYPYVFGEAFCRLQGFAAETSANATVLTITAFTIERYVAICHPFLSHTMSKLSRAIKFIIAIWLMALLLAVPQAMSFGILVGMGDEQYVCTVNQTVIPHAFVISTMLFFVLPMTIISILYICIGVQLHRSTVGASRGDSIQMKHRVVSFSPAGQMDGCNTHANRLILARCANRPQLDEDGRKNFARNAQAAKHVVEMLVAVVVAFFICWAPFHAQRLFAIYSGDQSEDVISAYRVLTYISGVLYYISTSINPFLYHLMSHKFREAFKNTFKGLLCRNRRSTGNRCYSTLSGRSSQVNSNTDSCSRQSSLRYLDAEFARLHDAKRPLVVSFKKKCVAHPKRAKQVTILDAELQMALDNLNAESMRREMFDKVHQHFRQQLEPWRTSFSHPIEFSCVPVHHLEPTHHCPVNGRYDHLRMEAKEAQKSRRFHTPYREAQNNEQDVTNGLFVWNSELTKSLTMPQITKGPNKNVGGGIRRKKDEEEEDERSNSCLHLKLND